MINQYRNVHVKLSAAVVGILPPGGTGASGCPAGLARKAESATKEVMRVIIRTRLRPEKKGSDLRLALRPGPTWQWRLFSSLMLAILVAILLVRPGSAATRAENLKTRPGPALNVVVMGDFYSYGYASSADPGLRSATPPTLQALNQIQAANQGVQVNVMFLPVADATKAMLYHPSNPGTRLAEPPQINAVKHADVVIVGVGASNASFARWMRTVLFGASASAKAFPQFMAHFDDGSYLRAQTALLRHIAERVVPGASIVTLGYPKVLPEQLPSGFTWWSPFSWTSISQRLANLANQLVSALNTANDQATSIVAAQYPGLHFMYADLSGALQGKGPFAPQEEQKTTKRAKTRNSPRNSLKQTIIGIGMLP